MGLLDRALNFAQKAYDYVVGNDNESKSAADNTSKTKKTTGSKSVKSGTVSQSNNAVNSVHNPSGKKTVGIVGDVLEKHNDKSVKDSNKTNSKTSKSKTLQMQSRVNFSASKKQCKDMVNQNLVQKKIAQLKIKIQDKCEKFGISYKEANDTILSQMQFSIDEFESLTPEEQLSVLYSIDGALGLYIINQGKRKIDSTVDKASVIGQTARNIMLAREEGGVNDVDEFSEEFGNINEEIKGKVKNDTTDEEYIEILEDSRKAFRASLELKRLAEIKKCNGDKSKIEEVNNQYDARLRAFEAQRQIDFAAASGAKKAHLSIYLRSGNDYSDAHAVALSLYDGDNKTVVADAFTHDFEMEARRRYYENGDAVSSEEYAKAVSYITQHMSSNALTKFQSDSADFRKKVENGEIKAPYMTKEDLLAESAAITKGIQNNNNLSDSAKQQMLEQSTKSSSKPESKKSEQKIIQSAISQSLTHPEQSENNIFADNIQAKKIVEEVGTKKATPEQLERALYVMTYEQVKTQFTKNTDREIAEVVTHNPKLKGHLHNVISYIKPQSPENIHDIIYGCSTDVFLYVLRNISPDKAGHLYDLSKGEKCYAARKLGEQVIEESQNYEIS